MEVKAGTRLRSATDTTEVIVVMAPEGDVDLRCGGVPFDLMEGEASAGAAIESGFDQGTLVGKRYADEEIGIELLCTKGGPASISIGTTILAQKGSKALPASD